MKNSVAFAFALLSSCVVTTNGELSKPLPPDPVAVIAQSKVTGKVAGWKPFPGASIRLETHNGVNRGVAEGKTLFQPDGQFAFALPTGDALAPLLKVGTVTSACSSLVETPSVKGFVATFAVYNPAGVALGVLKNDSVEYVYVEGPTQLTGSCLPNGTVVALALRAGWNAIHVTGGDANSSRWSYMATPAQPPVQ